MNLQPVPPASSGAVLYVFCACCGRKTATDEAKADLDDVPGTYYCPPCAATYRNATMQTRTA